MNNMTNQATNEQATANDEFEMMTNEESIRIAVAQKNDIAKKRVRAKIKQQAGDAATLLGVTTDTSQLLLHSFATLSTQLSTANSLADVRHAAQPFAELFASFLQKVGSGDVKLPFVGKGVEVVINDIETKATCVTNVLTEKL